MIDLKSKVQGFTLAEGLIVLAIIGVLAAMTIPVLMNKVEKHEEYVGFKKALSTLSDAAARIREDNGGSMAGLATSSSDVAELFKPYLKTIKYCGANDYSCYLGADSTIYTFNGLLSADSSSIKKNYSKIVTADGMVYIFSQIISSDCTDGRYQRSGNFEFCSGTFVDINGLKKPNMVGKDIFVISINKYNITPYRDMQNEIYFFCNKKSKQPSNGDDCGY